MPNDEKRRVLGGFWAGFGLFSELFSELFLGCFWTENGSQKVVAESKKWLVAGSKVG